MKLVIAWTVMTVRRPARWTVSGVVGSGLLLRPIVQGGVVEIAYAFTPEPEGTRFRRSISYAMPNALGRAADRWILDRRIERDVNPATETLERGRRGRHS